MTEAMCWVVLFHGSKFCFFNIQALSCLNNLIKPFIYDDTDESGDEGSEESMDTESVENGREPPPADSDISFNEVDGEVSD